MSTIEVIGESPAPSLAKADSEKTVANIWFKTKPVDRRFCYRAVQLQLETLSSDQGHDELHQTGSWSWFELAIFRDASSQQPVVKDGKTLLWRSHYDNRTDPFDTGESDSLHFGMIFDRRHDLFDDVEIGNVIGVRVCARHEA